ncbi:MULTISPECIES: ABC transporter permease subunit [unclassified Exiguobacterium]|uniref:ABC transporter permease subunit n=1 Tax=unclassified Exiguobacterium TaxID=2644629 RepID=UPI001BEBAEB7|nr:MULTISPECIES: ABC transporter permease subunit [unclassified Exiguobacterium]
MPSKVLLKKDWKQVSLLWILLVFLGVVAFTVPVWTQFEQFDEQIKDARANSVDYGIPFEERGKLTVESFFDPESSLAFYFGDIGSVIPLGPVVFLFVVFSALMATSLIGAERNSQMSDFSMSLPFTRTQLYISKWVLGVSGILMSTLIGSIAMFTLIATSRYSFLLEGTVVKSVVIVLYIALIGISLFSLSLWMGSFGGESISQATWSFVALIFPLGIIALIQGSAYALTSLDGLSIWMDNMYNSVFIQVVSPLGNLTNLNVYEYIRSDKDWIDFVMINIPSSILFILLSYGLGVWMYNRAPQENNGRFFMFNNWLWLVHIIIVLCIAMFTGIVFTTFTYQANSMLYIVGFLIGAFLAHLLAKRLLYRFNLKLKS